MWMHRYFLILLYCGVAAVKCQSSSCTTPNGEAASCTPLLRCRILIKAAISDEPIATRFFNESICDEKTSMVCCGTFGNFTKIPTTLKPLNESEQFKILSKEAKKDYVLKRLLPTKIYCGMQHTDDYFYNDTETSVDELVYIVEWNVVHDFNYYLRAENNCIGVLIGRQYVLLTKKCRLFAQFALTNPVEMLFGLHHIYKEISCIGTSFGVEDCTNPFLRIISSQWKRYNNVALLRLDNKIEYSDFVRPICLPLKNDEVAKTGTTIVISGWGEEQFVKGKNVKLKKRMKYTVMSKEECENGNPVKNPICGVPLENNNGGPLMYRHKKNWFVAGLVSQTEVCEENQPVTALRLTPEILNWVLENIEP